MLAPATGVGLAVCTFVACAQESPRPAGQPGGAPAPGQVRPFDAVADAQTPRAVPATRPEQQKNAHDQSDVFEAAKSPRSSRVFETQPQKGEVQGFDFYRDPLDAKRPMQPPEYR